MCQKPISLVQFPSQSLGNISRTFACCHPPGEFRDQRCRQTERDSVRRHYAKIPHKRARQTEHLSPRPAVWVGNRSALPVSIGVERKREARGLPYRNYRNNAAPLYSCNLEYQTTKKESPRRPMASVGWVEKTNRKSRCDIQPKWPSARRAWLPSWPAAVSHHVHPALTAERDQTWRWAPVPLRRN